MWSCGQTNSPRTRVTPEYQSTEGHRHNCRHGAGQAMGVFGARHPQQQRGSAHQHVLTFQSCILVCTLGYLVRTPRMPVGRGQR